MAIYGHNGDKAREKIMTSSDKNDKKVYLVAHELKLARVLAGNNKAARDRALKALKQWFSLRSKTEPFTEDDLQRIWKGLFYAMWMSDKPLVQEQCAEDISNLVHFSAVKNSLLFFKAGMTILMNEWFGIDQLRLDKFLMLVRRLLRQMFVSLREHGLSKEHIENFTDVLSNTILNTETEPPIGLFMHFTEIFLEEFAKVTKGKITSFVDLLRPFVKKLAVTDDRRQSGHIRKFIFTHLIRQTDLGLEYQAKYEAWKKLGFPGSIHNMQKVKLDKEEIMSSNKSLNECSDEESEESKSSEKALDPRAGRVDVELPQIKFNAKMIAALLLQYKFDKNSNAKSRSMISKLADQFTKLANGIYPLGVTKVIDDNNYYDTSIRKATNRLVKFEKKIMAKDQKAKKRKRHSESNDEQPEVKKKRRKLDEFSDKNQEVVKAKSLKNSKIKNNQKESTESVEKVKSNYKDLAEFIKKSEGKIKKQITNRVTHNKTERKNKKNKLKNTQTVIDNIECVFERNSGTWVVYDTSKEREENGAPSKQTGDSNEFLIASEVEQTPSKSLDISVDAPETSTKTNTSLTANKMSSHTGVSSIPKNSSGKTKGSPLNSAVTEHNESPKSGLNPVKLFESPPKQEELFPKSEWDEPLQEGEYEICIPSKKYIGKTRALEKKKNRQSLHILVNTSMKIKGKSRHSLDPVLVKNPFATPTSTKKVKINTKLNMSQEVHEHHAQIKNSPGIPYDANKKPSKPLLKSNFSSTPINPFYNKQLNVC